MKIVKTYGYCVEIGFANFNWLTGLATLNKAADDLRVLARRICKAAGVYQPDYNPSRHVEVNFPESTILITVDGGDKGTDGCAAIVAEAQKRHFKLVK